MPLYGYARVSTRDQDLAAQEAELVAAGCAKVFKEKISGAKTDRPELAKVIRRLEGLHRTRLPVSIPRPNARALRATKGDQTHEQRGRNALIALNNLSAG